MLKNVKISGKLSAMMLISIVAFIVFLVVSQICLNTVRINGDIYNDINNGKDLVADILPPPAYIIEPYLIAQEMYQDIGKTAEIDEYVAKIQQLESDYDARHEFWTKTLGPGSIHDAFLVDSYPPAKDFFGVMSSEYIPAVKNGDRDSAHALLNGKLKENYEANRKAIDTVVTLTNASNEALVKNAQQVLDITNYVNYGIAAAAVALIIFLGFAIGRSITRPIKKLVTAANDIANGNLNIVIDTQGKDEIGILSEAFVKIKESLGRLIKDTDTLSSAALAGKLAIRADEMLHKGDYRKIITGFNHTLDAVTQPLNLAADRIMRISQGDIPELVTEEYAGDFEVLRNNINTLISSINALLEDVSVMDAAAGGGNLSIRVDENRHQGDYKRIISGLTIRFLRWRPRWKKRRQFYSSFHRAT